MDNHLPARANVGTVDGHRGSVPPTARAEHDLSPGTVTMQFQLTAATTIDNSRLEPTKQADWRGRKLLCDLESIVKISIAG